MELEYLPGGHPDPQNIINSNFDLIMAIINSIADSGWIPVALKNGATGDARIAKIGNVIILDFSITGPTAGPGTGGANSFAQIPEGYRPSRDYSFPAGTNSVGAQGDIRVSRDNGDVSMWASANPAATHTASFVYKV